MNVTPWHNGYQKPVRAGMFERFRRGVVEWSWFNVDTGKWGIGMLCSCSSCMEHSRDGESDAQHCSWRGREAETLGEMIAEKRSPFEAFFHNSAMDDFGFHIEYHFGLARQHITARRLRFILTARCEEH